MGGKSRKSGGVSKKLIDQIKRQNSTPLKKKEPSNAPLFKNSKTKKNNT